MYLLRDHCHGLGSAFVSSAVAEVSSATSSIALRETRSTAAGTAALPLLNGRADFVSPFGP